MVLERKAGQGRSPTDDAGAGDWRCIESSRSGWLSELLDDALVDLLLNSAGDAFLMFWRMDEAVQFAASEPKFEVALQERFPTAQLAVLVSLDAALSWVDRSTGQNVLRDAVFAGEPVLIDVALRCHNAHDGIPIVLHVLSDAGWERYHHQISEWSLQSLLLRMRRFGQSRVRATLEGTGLEPTQRVGALTREQRHALGRRLEAIRVRRQPAANAD